MVKEMLAKKIIYTPPKVLKVGFDETDVEKISVKKSNFDWCTNTGSTAAGPCNHGSVAY